MSFFFGGLKKRNSVAWLFTVLIVIATTALSSGGFASEGQETPKKYPQPTPPSEIKNTRDLSRYGVVDYTAFPKDQSSERFFANQRYDNLAWVFKKVYPGAGGVGMVEETPPPPLLPIDESALIVTGKVVGVRAFLSNDKGGVYSEFTIRPEEILKDSSPGTPKRIVADRKGGVVRYPNGQRIRYQSSDLELPQLGGAYLFFLKSDSPSPNYRIVRSYELTDKGVRQLETPRQFDEFKDVSKFAFIQSVRNKITRPE